MSLLREGERRSLRRTPAPRLDAVDEVRKTCLISTCYSFDIISRPADTPAVVASAPRGAADRWSRRQNAQTAPRGAWIVRLTPI